MAVIKKEAIKSHKSIYSSNPQERYINIEYSLPSDGVNTFTGLLVLIPGYGGQLFSNVYRHIREDFSDKYNLIVVQADYFGHEYMQATSHNELNALINSSSPESNIESHNSLPESDIISYNFPLDESSDNLNDMGIIQAMDIINATLHVLTSLDGDVDADRFFMFGMSHGAYLAYLANILCPGLFSHLFDVSGYLTPFYLTQARKYPISLGEKQFAVYYDYLISRDASLRYATELYDLTFMYSQIPNCCHIISFNGIGDWMVSPFTKKKFVESIPCSDFILVKEEMLDMKIFKDIGHGLGLNFIEFLHYMMSEYRYNPTPCNSLMISDVDISGYLKVSYSNIFPEILFVKGIYEK